MGSENEKIVFNTTAFKRLLEETKEEGMEIGYQKAIQAIRETDTNKATIGKVFGDYLEENKERILNGDEQ